MRADCWLWEVAKPVCDVRGSSQHLAPKVRGPGLQGMQTHAALLSPVKLC